jgi:hypothetical protein
MEDDYFINNKDIDIKFVGNIILLFELIPVISLRFHNNSLSFATNLIHLF